ncbi:MAG: hypothetical protein ACREDC_14405, partial [Bradyrhizobium sp.]
IGSGWYEMLDFTSPGGSLKQREIGSVRIRSVKAESGPIFGLAALRQRDIIGATSSPGAGVRHLARGCAASAKLASVDRHDTMRRREMM